MSRSRDVSVRARGELLRPHTCNPSPAFTETILQDLDFVDFPRAMAELRTPSLSWHQFIATDDSGHSRVSTVCMIMPGMWRRTDAGSSRPPPTGPSSSPATANNTPPLHIAAKYSGGFFLLYSQFWCQELMDITVFSLQWTVATADCSFTALLCLSLVGCLDVVRCIML